MISGFTTTGSSILPNVEALSRCMLLWRSFSHWLGGMGILVFMLAIVKMEGGQGIHLLRAESPGPTVGKMVPRMVDSSKILYSIYLALTLVQLDLLSCRRHAAFDSLCNAFCNCGHGRLCYQGRLLCGLQRLCADGHDGVHGAVRRELLDLFLPAAEKSSIWHSKTPSFRWYVGIILTSIAIITANILPMYPSFHAAVHHAAFSVSSVITTTGFCTENFDLWPEFSRA